MPTLFAKPGSYGIRYVPGVYQCPHCHMNLSWFVEHRLSGSACPRCEEAIYYLSGVGRFYSPTLMGEEDFLRYIRQQMEGKRI